jgi:hypothetical protein
MPVTRFTSRPSFPIAECARDRLAPSGTVWRKPFLAIRSDAHPRIRTPAGWSFGDERGAPLGSRAGAEDDDARSWRVASALRSACASERSNAAAVAEKRDADRRDLNRDGHFETERLAFDRQPLGEPGEETRFLDQLSFSPADEQSRVLTLD